MNEGVLRRWCASTQRPQVPPVQPSNRPPPLTLSRIDRALEAAGEHGAGAALAGDIVRSGQAAADEAAARLAALRRAALCVQASVLLPLSVQAAALGRRAAPVPSDYLGEVRALLTASAPAAPGEAAGQPGAAPPPAGVHPPQPRCMPCDSREVALELTPSPSNPATVTLRLRPLAPARTQEAIAAKLAGRSRQAALAAALRQRLAVAEHQRQLRLRMRSAERAALLAGHRPSGGPLPHPQLALDQVLRNGLPAAHAGEPGGAPARPPHPAAALRASLCLGVLQQHKEARKAWREKQ